MYCQAPLIPFEKQTGGKTPPVRFCVCCSTRTRDAFRSDRPTGRDLADLGLRPADSFLMDPADSDCARSVVTGFSAALDHSSFDLDRSFV
jgi:hypothetical protein